MSNGFHLPTVGLKESVLLQIDGNPAVQGHRTPEDRKRDGAEQEV